MPPRIPSVASGCSQLEIGLIDVANGALTQLANQGAFEPQSACTAGP
jgi:hypothetical protein